MNITIFLFFKEMGLDTSELLLKETTDIVPGTCQLIRQHIRDAKHIYFHVMREKDDVLYGDIILPNLGIYQSLIQEMVKAKVLSINENLFEEGIN